MVKAFGLVLSIGLAVSGLSQSQDLSIITTKDGQRFVGKVRLDNDSIYVINLVNNNQVSIRPNNVNRFLSPDEITVYRGGRYHMHRGYFASIGLSMNVGGGEQEENNSSLLHVTIGAYLNPKFDLGFGFGSEFNSKIVGGITIANQVVPLYVYSRYYFTQHRRKLYTYGRLGYGFVIPEAASTDENNGGINLRAGGGILFASKSKAKFSLGLSFYMQKVKGIERIVDVFGNEASALYDFTYRRIMLDFAFEINRKGNPTKKRSIRNF